MGEESGEQLTIGKIFRGIFSVYTIALLCMCFVTFGSYFVYDTPGQIGFGITCNYANGQNGVMCTDDTGDQVTSQMDQMVLNADSGVDKDSLTTQNCMAACWRAEKDDYTWLATKDSDECFCSKRTSTFTALSATDYSKCNKMCSGEDTNEKNPGHDWYCGSAEAKAPNASYASATAYHCPVQTIEMRMRQANKKYSNTMNLSLYSVYSYPNAILALMGGMLIDRIGLRAGTLIFLTCIVSGEILFGFGVYQRSYIFMVLGRVLFGLGGESLTVAQSAYCARWFKRSGWMALAFGITLSFSRVGSSVGFIITPYLASNQSVTLAVWVGTAACLVSLTAAVILALLDLWAEKRDIVESVSTDEPFKLSDLKKFGAEMVLITLLCIFYYCAVFPFNGIAVKFFHDKWHVSIVTAGFYVSIYTFVSAAGSPIIGLAVDRAGRPLIFMFLGCVLIIAAHIAFIFTKIIPVAIMVVVGLSITLLGASMWPSVAYVVDKRVLGSAYGLMTSVQNLGLAVTPQIIGTVRDKTQMQGLVSYYYCIWILMGLAALATVIVVLLWVLDTARNGVLMCSTTVRSERMRLKETEATGLLNP